MMDIDQVKPKKESIVSPCGVDLTKLEATLPQTLRRLLAPHTDTNEWLMALLSNISVAGGLIPNVWAEYAGRRTYPMLMLFVVCPPASGKGAVGLSGRLLERINRHLHEKYKVALSAYQQEEDLYKASLKSGSLSIPPVKPKRSQLLVPGNITGSKLIHQLADNEQIPLVMIETEADVLASSFKNEHGMQISALIRQAFHHERISLSRRANDEIVEVETPKVALILTVYVVK